MCQNMRYKYKLLIVSILRYVVNILEGAQYGEYGESLWNFSP